MIDTSTMGFFLLFIFILNDLWVCGNSKPQSGWFVTLWIICEVKNLICLLYLVFNFIFFMM